MSEVLLVVVFSVSFGFDLSIFVLLGVFCVVTFAALVGDFFGRCGWVRL